MKSYGGQAINHYRQMGEQVQIKDASPHQLIQLMLDGALGRVAAARGALVAGDLAVKGELIGKAIGLIEGLRVSLDMEAGGDLAENLRALYEYLGRRLLQANLYNDGAILQEVASLLRELQSGWCEMGRVITGARTYAATSGALGTN
jgi:flagellar protein FliS